MTSSSSSSVTQSQYSYFFLHCECDLLALPLIIPSNVPKCYPYYAFQQILEIVMEKTKISGIKGEKQLLKGKTGGQAD